MPIVTDIQQLSITPKVELFEINNFDPQNAGIVFRFCNLGLVKFKGSEYQSIPCRSEGFVLTGQSLPRPRLTVTNIHGLLSSIVSGYNDLIGATLTRIVTFEKYLDGLPTANPLQEVETSVWTIEQKLSDTEEDITWEMSFAGLEGLKLPRRRFFSDYCDIQYRSARCGYLGGAVGTIDDTPTTNPALDRCGKRVSSCKLRNNTLHYGGVPGARL